jgi:hypothetical protein
VPEKEGWQELRIPLTWMDMHDAPISGISFLQYGGGRVTWDRTAVVFDGRERVFFDDTPPEGKLDGEWRWVGGPRRSGSKAHTDANPGGEYTSCQRTVRAFEAPIIDHVLPPLRGPVLSQWVYVDPKSLPKMIALTLQERSDHGFRAIWGRALVDGRYMGPLPKPGQWHELRLPLVWTPLHTRPIRGITFEQHGGRVVWDRTAVVKDGRDHVVIDDEMPTGSSKWSTWQWVEKPVKSGKKAHTQENPGGHGGHNVLYLKEPIVQHLPFDVSGAISTLQRHIPSLGPSDEALTFFNVLRTLARRDTRRQIELTTWFLKAIPDHPNGVRLLKSLLSAYDDIHDPDPVRAVEAVIEECRPPRAIRSEFRRKYTRGSGSFIRTWRVIGPFPNPESRGLATPYPPETEEVRLNEAYEAMGGKARWRFHRSEKELIDLAPLFKPNEHVVAYAVCWVYSDRVRFAALEVGSDDGCKLWVNRKVVLDHLIERAAEPRQDIVPIQLRRGWNEILVKIEQGKVDWSFYLELVDREGRGLLNEVTVSTTPPTTPGPGDE